MILSNRRITIREVVDDVGVSFGLCQAIFTHVLGMKRAAVKIVPKLLNFHQKLRLMDIAQEMLTRTFSETFRFAQKGHNWPPLNFFSFQN